jgi:hypothetical protein
MSTSGGFACDLRLRGSVRLCQKGDRSIGDVAKELDLPMNAMMQATLQNAPQLADILGQIAPLKQAALEQFAHATTEDKRALANLVSAQQNLGVARQKLDEYLRDYEEFRANSVALKANLRNQAGGLVRTFLGPAAQVGPIASLGIDCSDNARSRLIEPLPRFRGHTSSTVDRRRRLRGHGWGDGNASPRVLPHGPALCSEHHDNVTPSLPTTSPLLGHPCARLLHDQVGRAFMDGDQGTVVDDPILERLDAQVRAEEELQAAMGVGAKRSARGQEEHEEPAPYDLEPEAPRALSFPKLMELAGQPLPPEVSATLGDYRAIVLLHGLTPFHRKGQRPSEIWGMGYEAALVDAKTARTVAYEPGNQVIKVAQADQSVTLDLAANGQLSAGTPGGLPLPLAAGLAASASTKQGFLLSLHVEWSAVEIQAGPVGAGGIRWNLYRQTSRIDRHHRLIQTALIDASTKTLKVNVRTWIRRRGGFFGLFGTREWSAPTRSFEIPIETRP